VIICNALERKARLQADQSLLDLARTTVANRLSLFLPGNRKKPDVQLPGDSEKIYQSIGSIIEAFGSVQPLAAENSEKRRSREYRAITLQHCASL